jgi:hypothetical protein
MSERVMSGKVALLPPQVEPQTPRPRQCFHHPRVCCFKGFKTVPQAVSKSICHQFASIMGFGTTDFCHSEAMVLWLNRATLPLVSASFSLGLIPFLCPYCLSPFLKRITFHLCFETGL